MLSPRLRLFQNCGSFSKSAKILVNCVMSCTFADENDESKGSTGVGDKGGNGVVADGIAYLFFDCLVGFCCFLIFMEL